MAEAILDCAKKRITIRIWVSLEGLIPEEDIVIGSDGILELVTGITSDELTTISRINERGVISQNSRPLVNYAPMRMKPDRIPFYPGSWDSVKREVYDNYKDKLIKAWIYNENNKFRFERINSF